MIGASPRATYRNETPVRRSVVAGNGLLFVYEGDAVPGLTPLRRSNRHGGDGEWWKGRSGSAKPPVTGQSAGPWRRWTGGL